MLLPLLFIHFSAGLEIPLAPYNVKVFCRQGLRFTRTSQTAQECPSSATACGYLEFSTPNKTGLESTGIFDCVESGMLVNHESLEAEEETNREFVSNVLFEHMCGAQASCSSLRMEELNPAFTRYLVMTHGIRLEELQDSQIRFCCSLFHATLQKLIVSGADRLPAPSASSMHCGGETCAASAVGCLHHSTGFSDSDEYEDRRVRRRRENADEDYQINAVEISFDDEDDSSLVLVSRDPTTTMAVMNTSSQFLPSLNLPMYPPKPPPSKVKNGVKYVIIDEEEEEDDNVDIEETEEQHCVYRHLNDELYRWCLFVHQSKTGDRCYFHQGHTICCCFAPPDTDTCDPTEMELVIPGKQQKTQPPPIKITPRVVITSTSPTTTTSTTSTTSTTTSTTTTTSQPPTTRTIMRTTAVLGTTAAPRCRIKYVKIKGRLKPVHICSGSFKLMSFSFLLLLLLLF